jgi:hypothetical protein
VLDRLRLPLAVSHADVAMHMAFQSPADYFHRGELDRSWWKDVRTLDEMTLPMTFGEHAFVVANGDVLADVTLSDGGAMIVYGNVRSAIDTNGQCEVVVAGDLCEGSFVSGDHNSILHVFVGGDLSGHLYSRGSCKAWIEGKMDGKVWTGHPSTELRVGGDCTGTIRPIDKPSLLYVQVDGFMAYAALEATAAAGYTHFDASIGRSDRPPGLYPDKTAANSLRQHRSYNRWVICGTETVG